MGSSLNICRCEKISSRLDRSMFEEALGPERPALQGGAAARLLQGLAASLLRVLQRCDGHARRAVDVERVLLEI